MILHIKTLAALAVCGIAAAQNFDCASIDIDGHKYDISAFKTAGPYTVKGTEYISRPSTLRDDYVLNPCQELTVKENELDKNCDKGAWVCKDVKRIKDNTEETIFLQSIAGTFAAKGDDAARDVAATTTRATKIEGVDALPWTLTLKGGYANNANQSAVINFVCDSTVTDEKVGPTLASYVDNVATFSWKHARACPTMSPAPAVEGMSGFGVFMTTLFVFGLVYLAVGAFYNNRVYGAKGLDLLPNLEFWRDFPALVVDVIRHVWDSIANRSTSGQGYVSV